VSVLAVKSTKDELIGSCEIDVSKFTTPESAKVERVLKLPLENCHDPNAQLEIKLVISRVQQQEEKKVEEEAKGTSSEEIAKVEALFNKAIRDLELEVQKFT